MSGSSHSPESTPGCFHLGRMRWQSCCDWAIAQSQEKQARACSWILEHLPWERLPSQRHACLSALSFPLFYIHLQVPSPERWLSSQTSFATEKITVDTISLSQQLWLKANEKIALWFESEGHAKKSGFHMSSPKGRICPSQQVLKACLLITLMPWKLLCCPHDVFYLGQRIPLHTLPPVTLGFEGGLTEVFVILRP